MVPVILVSMTCCTSPKFWSRKAPPNPCPALASNASTSRPCNLASSSSTPCLLASSTWQASTRSAPQALKSCTGWSSGVSAATTRS